MIGRPFGDEAKATFLSQWRGHIGYFVNYVTALAKKDDAGQEEAKKGLDGYIEEHGEFLAGATGLPADAVKAQLKMHVDELLKTIDDYAAGNYERPRPAPGCRSPTCTRRATRWPAASSPRRS